MYPYQYYGNTICNSLLTKFLSLDRCTDINTSLPEQRLALFPQEVTEDHLVLTFHYPPKSHSSRTVMKMNTYDQISEFKVRMHLKKRNTYLTAELMIIGANTSQIVIGSWARGARTLRCGIWRFTRANLQIRELEPREHDIPYWKIKILLPILVPISNSKSLILNLNPSSDDDSCLTVCIPWWPTRTVINVIQNCKTKFMRYDKTWNRSSSKPNGQIKVFWLRINHLRSQGTRNQPVHDGRR